MDSAINSTTEAIHPQIEISSETTLKSCLQAMQRVVSARISQQPLAEQWRYTRPDQLPLSLLGSKPQSILKGITLSDIFGLERLPRGVTLLKDSDKVNDGQTGKLFSQFGHLLGAATIKDPVAARHFCSLQSCAVVRTEKDMTVRELAVVSPHLSPEAEIESPYVIVHAQAHSSLTLLIDESSIACGFFAPWYEFVVEGGASVNVIVLQDHAETVRSLARHRFHVSRDAKVNCTVVSLGGKVNRIDAEYILREPGSAVTVRALSIASGIQHLDFHPSQIHCAPHATSDLLAKAVVHQKARNVYFGLIDVEPVAQCTDAYQKSENLLMSETARADAIPNLVIGANDVKCSHGASVGQLDEEEIFYAMTRGISRREAVRLLVQGFIDGIISEIRDEPLREKIAQHVRKKVEGLQGAI